MQVPVNTGAHIDGREALTAHVEHEVEAALGRFGDWITRVEVHLSDESAGKAGGHRKCLMEARLAGRQPAAASHESPHLHEAIAGALKKLTRLLETAHGRLDAH